MPAKFQSSQKIRDKLYAYLKTLAPIFIHCSIGLTRGNINVERHCLSCGMERLSDQCVLITERVV